MEGGVISRSSGWRDFFSSFFYEREIVTGHGFIYLLKSGEFILGAAAIGIIIPPVSSLKRYGDWP